jgi:hypothetical protein
MAFELEVISEGKHADLLMTIRVPPFSISSALEGGTEGAGLLVLRTT